MIKYTVTVKSQTENAFVGIQLGESGYFEFEQFSVDGNEIYSVYAEYDIDTQLDRVDNVVSYEQK